MALPKKLNLLKILDLMPYEKKVMRWGEEDPVRYDVRLKNTKSFAFPAISVDDAGNVLAMPCLAGRPCFGIPTAFLRHGRAQAQYVHRLKERVRNSRCDRCKVRDACIGLCKVRIKHVARSDPKFRDALEKWGAAGGLEPGGFHRASTSLPKAVWGELKYRLSLVSFESTNDIYVREYWAAKEVEYAERDAGAMRTKLQAKWKAGNEIALLAEGLDKGRREREELLLAALRGEECPPYLKWVKEASVERYGAVWWGREFATLTGKKLNPNSIATCLIEQRRALGKSHSVLRDAVKSDLAKIKKLESAAAYNRGNAIWPKFRHPALTKPPTSLHQVGYVDPYI